MKVIYSILILLILTSCKTISVYDAAVNKLVGNKSAYDELINSKPIEVCKLSPGLSFDQFNSLKNNNWILEYSKIKGKKLNYNDSIFESISNLAFDINSYYYGKKVMCEANYGFMLHYANYKVLFCFNCDLVLICNKKKYLGGGLLREDQSTTLKNIFLSLNENHN